MSALIREKERQQERITHNLRDIVRNLGAEYNIKNNIYNDQQDLLDKYIYTINMQNKKLNQQLNELEDIQNKIATRDSLVRQNEEAYSYKNKYIHALIIFFAFVGYLIFIIVGYLGKRISLAALLTNFIVVIIAYLIYLAWYFNFFGTRSFFNFSMKELEKARRDIYREGRRIEDEMDHYISDNCDCPDGKNGKNGKNGKRKNMIPASEIRPRYFGKAAGDENDGYFYYDGTAPQDRIVPPITPKYSKERPGNIGGYQFYIDWETAQDMGNRSTGRYTPPPTFMPKKYGLAKGTDRDETGCDVRKGKGMKRYWAVDL